MDIIENAPRKRGRPKKVKLSYDDQLDELLLKLYNPVQDENGNLKFERNNEVATLEDTSLLIWAIEGRKTPTPMTKMGILQVEAKALRKMRDGLKKYGIKSFDDVFDIGKRRTYACYDKLDDSEAD